MLSYDNQLRFFDFLVSLSEPTMISRLADSIDLSGLATSHEVVCRIVSFMRFLDGLNISDEKTIDSIFQLLTQMLQAPFQSSETFHIVFSSLANFANKFVDLILKSRTVLINTIISAVVEITKRRLYDARVEAVGFLLWLIEREQRIRPNVTRIRLALQFAVCDSYFVSGPVIPFWNHMPRTVKSISDYYDKLVSSVKNCSLYENEIVALLNVYGQFRDFPSIRGRIYSHIVDVNNKNGDKIAAFVAQWRLCALISDVFRLKNEEVEGLSQAPFPFIVDEPPIRLADHPSDSQYLVMYSPMFNEVFLSRALEKALELCQEADLHWLIGDVTQVLFSNL
jgi:hypothetical protein